MSKSRTSVLKYTGIGCLVLIGLVVLLLVGSVTCIQIDGSRTISSREKLDARYPDAAGFTPAADGGLGTDRIQRFLAVRRELMTFCPDFQEYTAAFDRMGGYEGMEEDEMPTGEFFSDVGSALKSTFGMAGKLNDYLLLRNRSLLELEMGHGEYTWLYVMIYHVWLDNPPRRFMIANEDEPWMFEARIRPQVRAMFQRWAESAENRNRWDFELRLLELDPERLPFAGELPASVTIDLEPFRAELEASVCEVTDELDLTRTEREGIGFEHN